MTFVKIAFYPLVWLVAQRPHMGALPSIRASTAPEVEGGDYYGPGGRNEQKGYPVRVKSNPASHNRADAEKLWEISQKLTGIEFL